MGTKYFSELEIDAIGEILNISLGASATAVSTMLNNRVDITTPIVNVVSKEEFRLDKIDPAVGVEITYVSGLEGNNVMLLKRHDVKVIVEMLMGMTMSDDEFEMNEMNISAVCEVMNQMMGASSTALSEFLGQMVNISTPVSFEVKDEEEFIDKYFDHGGAKVVVGFTLKIADQLESEFFNVMPIELAKGLVKGFLPEEAIIPYDPANPTGEAKPEPQPEVSGGGNGVVDQDEADAMIAKMLAEAAAEPAPAPVVEQSSSGGVMDQGEADAMIAAMLAQAEAEAAPAPAPQPEPTPQPAPAPQPVPMAQPAPQMAVQTMSPDVAMMQMQMMQQMMQQMQQMQQKMEESQNKKQPAEPKVINVQPVTRPALNQDKDIVLEGEQEENMELIMGVPLEISVEIGRTRKMVKDILDFTKGSLVVLDKLAGEHVDLFVNGQCIAKGDVVVVEDNFGVRITEILKSSYTSPN